ncbi:MAG: signal peptidase I [Candidatus Shapirobacteria bacterium]
MVNLLKKLGQFLLETIETVVIALAVFVIVYLFLFAPHQVKGNSMYPSFHDGDYLLTDKISYRLNAPQPGDVIVFTAPQNREYDYIKRIIAAPLESVELCQGQVTVNNRLLMETYLPDNLKTLSGSFTKECQKITLGKDEFFVLGDNRSHSSDSREWGIVPRSLIIGKAWLRYWPVERWGVIPQIAP